MIELQFLCSSLVNSTIIVKQTKFDKNEYFYKNTSNTDILVYNCDSQGYFLTTRIKKLHTSSLRAKQFKTTISFSKFINSSPKLNLILISTKSSKKIKIKINFTAKNFLFFTFFYLNQKKRSNKVNKVYKKTRK